MWTRCNRDIRLDKAILHRQERERLARTELIGSEQAFAPALASQRTKFPSELRRRLDPNLQNLAGGVENERGGVTKLHDQHKE